MAYINDDEVLEVTPKHLRLRKNTWIITKEKECPKVTLKMFEIKNFLINF